MPSIEQALQEYRNTGNQQVQAESVLNKIASQGVQENVLRESAISPSKRALWGLADDYGKQRILMESGYGPEQVVRLKNGDYGIKTEYGIKPVDPKGFQMNDLAGDITESLGKAITTAGGMLGGAIAGAGTFGVGAGVGVAAGAATGEAIRQALGAGLGYRDPSKLAKVAFKDDAGWHLGGLGEIAGEGLLGGASTKIAGMLSSKLAQAGTIKQAANTADNILSTGEIKPTVLDAITDAIGLPKGTNKTLVREFVDPNGSIKYVAHEGAAFEHLQRAGNKVVALVEQGKNMADEIYSKGLKEAGIDMDSVRVPVSKGVKEIERSISEIMKSPLKKEASPVLKQLSDLKEWVTNNSINGELNLNQLKEVTSALYNIKDQTFASGVAGKFTGKASRPLAAFTAAKNSNPIISNLNKQYKPQLQALKKLQNIMNIRLEEGLAKEGRFTPEMFIQRLGNELKDRNLQAIIKADDVLSKSPEFKKMSIKQDLLTALFSNKLAEKAPMTGGRLSLSGITESTGKAALSPRRRAEMIKGMISTGVFNPKALDLEVSKTAPKLSAFFNLVAAGKTGPVLGKAVNSKAVKETGKVMTRQLLQKNTDSINNTLYGE